MVLSNTENLIDRMAALDWMIFLSHQKAYASLFFLFQWPYDFYMAQFSATVP